MKSSNKPSAARGGSGMESSARWGTLSAPVGIVSWCSVSEATGFPSWHEMQSHKRTERQKKVLIYIIPLYDFRVRRVETFASSFLSCEKRDKSKAFRCKENLIAKKYLPLRHKGSTIVDRCELRLSVICSFLWEKQCSLSKSKWTAIKFLKWSIDMMNQE